MSQRKKKVKESYTLSQTRMRVNESRQSQIVTEDILSFTMKIQKNKRFDYVNFHFSEIHDCVEKASSTAAKQDRMTASSHQLSSSFDLVLCQDTCGNNPVVNSVIITFATYMPAKFIPQLCKYLYTATRWRLSQVITILLCFVSFKFFNRQHNLLVIHCSSQWDRTRHSSQHIFSLNYMLIFATWLSIQKCEAMKSLWFSIIYHDRYVVLHASVLYACSILTDLFYSSFNS